MTKYGLIPLLSAVYFAYAAPQYSDSGNYYSNLSSHSPSNSSGARGGKIPVVWSDGTGGWLGTIAIGGQEQRLLMDTGSSDLWVCSTLLPQHVQNAAKNGLYQPSRSVKVLRDASWGIKYLDQSRATGDLVVYDTVTTQGGLMIQGQAIECASQVKGRARQSLSDAALGIVGMGVKTINTVAIGGERVPQDTLWQSSGFNFFTTHLGPADSQDIWFGIGHDDESARPGEYTFQDMDTSNGDLAVGGSKTTVVGGQRIENGVHTALLDTGTTLIAMDRETVDAVYQQIPGAQPTRDGVYIYECDTQLPQISLSIGSSMVDLDMSAFTMPEIREGSNLCQGAIQPIPDSPGPQKNIYGSLLFKSAYFRFEQDPNSGAMRVGFAPYAQRNSNGNSNTNTNTGGSVHGNGGDQSDGGDQSGNSGDQSGNVPVTGSDDGDQSGNQGTNSPAIGSDGGDQNGGNQMSSGGGCDGDGQREQARVQIVSPSASTSISDERAKNATARVAEKIAKLTPEDLTFRRYRGPTHGYRGLGNARNGAAS